MAKKVHYVDQVGRLNGTTLPNLKNVRATPLRPVDDRFRSVHGLRMASKTISLEIDAYERLKSARLERESFSQAVRRLVPAAPGRAVDLLASVNSGEFGRGVNWTAVERAVRGRSRRPRA